MTYLYLSSSASFGVSRSFLLPLCLLDWAFRLTLPVGRVCLRLAMLSQDFISDHPPEISGLILSYLSIDDLRNCARVCRTWRSYALQDMLYLPYVLERYNRLSHERSSTQNELGKHHIAKELLERFPRLSATTYFENSASLRDLAIRNLQLEKSWKSGKPSNITTVKLLNQPGRLTCATIDSISKAIIVGTTSEYVLVIGSECGNILQTFRLPSQWSSVLTVGKDSLVIGSHVCNSANFLSEDPY